jgi:hypothetical protein
MSVVQDLTEVLGESVYFTYRDSICLEGCVVASGISFNFEINLKLDVAVVAVAVMGLDSAQIKWLVDQQETGTSMKRRNLHLEKNVFLSGKQKMDTWLISQWLMTLISTVGELLKEGEEKRQEKTTRAFLSRGSYSNDDI